MTYGTTYIVRPCITPSKSGRPCPVLLGRHPVLVGPASSPFGTREGRLLVWRGHVGGMAAVRVQPGPLCVEADSVAVGQMPRPGPRSSAARSRRTTRRGPVFVREATSPTHFSAGVMVASDSRRRSSGLSNPGFSPRLVVRGLETTLAEGVRDGGQVPRLARRTTETRGHALGGRRRGAVSPGARRGPERPALSDGASRFRARSPPWGGWSDPFGAPAARRPPPRGKAGDSERTGTGAWLWCIQTMPSGPLPLDREGEPAGQHPGTASLPAVHADCRRRAWPGSARGHVGGVPRTIPSRVRFFATAASASWRAEVRTFRHLPPRRAGRKMFEGLMSRG